jgi:hypothetical protein
MATVSDKKLVDSLYLRNYREMSKFNENLPTISGITSGIKSRRKKS